MSNSIDDGIGYFIMLFIIVVVSLLCIISINVYDYFTEDEIKSEHLIEPQTELIIKDNKVDTIYIYKEPN